ncbi:FAD-binding oxidoreductase [Aquibium sp. A9E412]|nr:FAD-binding oxidoreductase [Aquibium sp. A9E412]MDN2565633.1 FAD-binding oxidoreductase [Aquibium sp. A9E412]
MENRSVTVIGGGIVGLCTAFHLQKRGARVTVIDRSFSTDGASSGNAGSVSPGSVVPVAYKGMIRDIPRMLLDPSGPLRVTVEGLRHHSLWLARFLMESSERRIRASAETLSKLLDASLSAHVDLLEAIGSLDLLQRTGQLHVYPDIRARERDRFGWNLRREYGVQVEELDREGILEIEPSIGPRYTAGMFLPEQGMIVDPGAYVGRLCSVLRQGGVRLVTDEVRTIELDGDRAVRLVCSQQTRECEEVVLCGGAWSRDLLRKIGVKLPLANQRGFHVEFEESGIGIRRIVVLADRKVFVTPMRQGVRAAGTVEITPLSSAVDMRRADALVGHVRQAWPALKEEPHSRWSGERPCLPDSLPVMGQTRSNPNLWLNFGHGHLGLTLSAVAGEEIAKSMAARRPTELTRRFDYSRFG